MFAGLVFAADTPAVTFNKDVLPILQKNCQSCHRPGQIAHVVSDLREHTAVGEIHENGGGDQEDATMVQRSGGGSFPE